MLRRASDTRCGSRSTSTTLALGNRAATQSPTTPTPAPASRTGPGRVRADQRGKKHGVRAGTIAVAGLTDFESAAEEKVLARRSFGKPLGLTCCSCPDHPLAKTGLLQDTAGTGPGVCRDNDASREGAD